MTRTLGWIQDAYRLDKLRRVVALLLHETELTHRELMPRVRSVLASKSRRWQWAADNYIRFAEALGFFAYLRPRDAYTLTTLGHELLASPIGSDRPVQPRLGEVVRESSPEWGDRDIKDSSDGEIDVFSRALLSYPPALRVLDLLSDGSQRSKFELGAELGFIGDRGFGSLPERFYVESIARGEAKPADFERTSDKYARGIARWLEQMGWVRREPKLVELPDGDQCYTAMIGHAYRITTTGLAAWRRGRGLGTQTSIAKRVTFEWLASGKEAVCEYARRRRAATLEHLLSRGSAGADAEEIAQYLSKRGITVAKTLVEHDLTKLARLGLQIAHVPPRYVLRDQVVMNVPPIEEFRLIDSGLVEDLVLQTEAELRYVPLRFLELIRQSFDPNRDRELEFGIYELLQNVVGLEGERLGGPYQPDVVVWHPDPFPRWRFGLIIDGKARKDGFALDVDTQAQMIRYVKSWQSNLMTRCEVPNAHFLFVSSRCRGRIDEGLQAIALQTQVDGAAISTRNLLLLADRMRADPQNYSPRAVRPLFASNTEITRDQIEALAVATA